MEQRRNGRFFGLRVDCERVPLLPAGIVRRILDDPCCGQYLLIWQNSLNGAIEEAVQVKRVTPPACFSGVEAIEVTRTDQSITDLHVFRRSMPKNGGMDVFLECPACLGFRRALYGWSAGGTTTRSVYRSQWQCRECAGLRYASEGGALVVRSRGYMGRMLGVARAERPTPWNPCVLESADTKGI